MERALILIGSDTNDGMEWNRARIESMGFQHLFPVIPKSRRPIDQNNTSRILQWAEKYFPVVYNYPFPADFRCISPSHFFVGPIPPKILPWILPWILCETFLLLLSIFFFINTTFSIYLYKKSDRWWFGSDGWLRSAGKSRELTRTENVNATVLMSLYLFLVSITRGILLRRCGRTRS